MSLASLLSLIPAGAWLLQFGGGEVSNRPESWADFATYAAGTTGVVLAALNLGVVVYLATIAQRLQQSEQARSKHLDTLVNLYSRWNTEAMYSARNRAFEFVARNPEIDYRTAALDPSRQEALSPLWVVKGFFEQLGVLSEEGLLPLTEMVPLFGHIFTWWDFAAFDHMPTDWAGSEHIIDLRKKVLAVAGENQVNEWRRQADSFIEAARSRAAGGTQLDGLLNLM